MKRVIKFNRVNDRGIKASSNMRLIAVVVSLLLIGFVIS